MLKSQKDISNRQAFQHSSSKTMEAECFHHYRVRKVFNCWLLKLRKRKPGISFRLNLIDLVKEGSMEVQMSLFTQPMNQNNRKTYSVKAGDIYEERRRRVDRP